MGFFQKVVEFFSKDKKANKDFINKEDKFEKGFLKSINNSNTYKEEKTIENIYIESNYSAKDILDYVVIFTKEFGMSDLVYFEIK